MRFMDASWMMLAGFLAAHWLAAFSADFRAPILGERSAAESVTN
jgi:hypothetical protein